MQHGIDEMRTALRVLAALTDKRHPDHVDVAILRSFAGPEWGNIAIDELACEVIQQALKRRADAQR